MRLFVAILVPDAVREECRRIADELKPLLPNARWVPPENMHLTIAFLGSVAEPQPVIESLQRSTAPLRRMTLTCAGVGCFPNTRRARVVWVGLSGDLEPLANAVHAIRSGLGSVGFAIEERAFSAHLTIARLADPVSDLADAVSASVELSASVDPIRFEVREVALMRSRLGRPAPRYDVLHTFPLG